MSNTVWGNLPEQGWLAVVADRGHENGPRIEVVGFDNEDDAYNFCTSYDSICYEWAVITGCICTSGSVSDGREDF